MEKIKFKIWDKHTKVMSEPFEITELVDFNLIWKEKFKGQKEVSFCDLVWLQWTGLIDKNGIDIFTRSCGSVNTINPNTTKISFL